MENLVLVTPPVSAINVISVADLKEHMRITHTDDDAYITDLAEVAYNWIEDEADITLLDTTWRLVLDGLSASSIIYLPKPPLITVDEVQYYDADEVSQTLTSDDYYLITPYRLPAYLKIKYDVDITTYERPDAASITFTAGFSSIPQQVGHLMRLLVANMYEHREAEIILRTNALQLGVDRLLAQIKNYRYV